MELKIEIEPRETYLYICVKGNYEINKAKELLRDAIEAAAKHALNKVLVDFREMEGNPPTQMDRYNCASFMAELLLEMRVTLYLPILRFAYVGIAPFFDPSGFGETVAANRGVIIKITDDFEESLAWLLREDISNKMDAVASED